MSNYKTIWGHPLNKMKPKNEVDDIDINGNYFSDPYFMYTSIRRCGNKIYFYDDVNHISQMVLIQLLNDIQADIISKNAASIINGNCPEKIEIYINSYGGVLSSGFALYDFIRSLQVPTVGIVDGVAMSAATLILLACDERKMGDNSTVLIHQLSSGGFSWSTYEQMNDEKHNVDNAMAKLRRIYLDSTSIGLTQEMKDKLDKLFEDPETQEDAERYYESLYEERLITLNNLLKHDIELSKEECERFGIIDDPDSGVEFDENDQMKLQEFVEKMLKQKMKNTKKEKTTKTTSTSSKKKSKN